MRSRFVMLCLVALVGCGGSEPAGPVTSGPEVDAVRAAFDEYRSALLDKDGETAAGRVTGSTIAKYQEYRDLALTAGRAELHEISFVDRFTALIVRHTVGFDVEAMDGRALFVYAVDEGLIGEDALVGQSLGTVTVEGDRATAETAGGAGGLEYSFIKEEGTWRLDITKLLAAVGPALRAAARQQGLSPDRFMLQLIEDSSGRAVTEEIWEPLE